MTVRLRRNIFERNILTDCIFHRREAERNPKFGKFWRNKKGGLQAKAKRNKKKANTPGITASDILEAIKVLPPLPLCLFPPPLPSSLSKGRTEDWKEGRW
jgi:hypothetical protein